MHRLDKVSISDDHSIAVCWHPHYHLSPFNHILAKIFEVWHRENYGKETGTFLRAAPLCIFGGVSFSRYVLKEQAGGTYAVCLSCEEVMMCGYGEDGISPDHCEKCRKPLLLNNYFQSVLAGSETSEKMLVDPEHDPAVTIAEACALSPDGNGISIFTFEAVIAILKDKDYLATGENIDDLFIIGDGVLSRERISPHSESDWTIVDSTSKNMVRNLTENGRIMLKAQGIRPHPRALIFMRKLLSQRNEVIRALACKAIADQNLKRLLKTARSK